VATVAAVKNPSLVRSLIVYESGLVSVLSEESVEGKAAREDRAKIFGPAIAAAKAGDAIQAAKLLREGVMQLGPGGFDREPQATQTRVLDNARTVPLAFAAPPSPAITCDMLKSFARPTLVMRGDKTQPYFALISDAISKCVPAARLDVLKDVHHGGPHQDPAAFTAAVFEFLSQRAFLIAPAMSPGAQQ
jgi:pimeloyl-ACP methyl ester carboxylesterase